MIAKINVTAYTYQVGEIKLENKVTLSSIKKELQEYTQDKQSFFLKQALKNLNLIPISEFVSSSIITLISISSEDQISFEEFQKFTKLAKAELESRGFKTNCIQAYEDNTYLFQIHGW